MAVIGCVCSESNKYKKNRTIKRKYYNSGIEKYSTTDYGGYVARFRNICDIQLSYD